MFSRSVRRAERMNSMLPRDVVDGSSVVVIGVSTWFESCAGYLDRSTFASIGESFGGGGGGGGTGSVHLDLLLLLPPSSATVQRTAAFSSARRPACSIFCCLFSSQL